MSGFLGTFFWAIFHKVHRTPVCRLYDFCIVTICPPLFTFPGSFSVKIFRHPLCIFHQVHLALVCRLYDFCIVLHSSPFPGNFRVKIPSLFAIFHQVYQAQCLALVCRLYGFCIALNYSLFQAIYLQIPTTFNRYFFAVYNVSVLFSIPHCSGKASSMSGFIGTFFAIFHQVHQALVCRLFGFCIVLQSSLFQAISVL